MGWFDGSSPVGRRDNSPGRSSVYSKSGKKKKVTTGSSFGDWAAGIKKSDKNKSTGSFFSVDVDWDDGKDRKRDKERERERLYKGENRSTGSFFGIVPEGKVYRDGYKNRSTASFFGGGSPRSTTSSYRRSPRKGYLARMYKKLRRLIKKTIRYMKTHPLKVFMLVIMPLITGGALTALLATFGLRLPRSLERLIAKISGKPSYGDLIGVGATAMGMGGGMKTSVERGRDGSLQWERKKVTGPLESFGGIGGVMDGVGGIMSVAKLFI